MAQPTSRTEFKEWCLRKLGKPVIEINVDDDQVEDRIDEALSYYWDYHADGSQKEYVAYQIQQSDIDNGYVSVAENIIGITGIFDTGTSLSGDSGIFSYKYQFSLNEAHRLGISGLSHYYMNMEYLSLMQEILAGSKLIRYNRHINRLYIDTMDDIDVGNYIVADCYSIVDPDTYTDVWKDRWLQNYATEKIRHQWGTNLTKFEGMTLPGGVTFNGQQIKQDAQEEIVRLETDMVFNYSMPVMDMLG